MAYCCLSHCIQALLISFKNRLHPAHPHSLFHSYLGPWLCGLSSVSTHFPSPDLILLISHLFVLAIAIPLPPTFINGLSINMTSLDSKSSSLINNSPLEPVFSLCGDPFSWYIQLASRHLRLSFSSIFRSP